MSDAREPRDRREESKEQPKLTPMEESMLRFASEYTEKLWSEHFKRKERQQLSPDGLFFSDVFGGSCRLLAPKVQESGISKQTDPAIKK